MPMRGIGDTAVGYCQPKLEGDSSQQLVWVIAPSRPAVSETALERAVMRSQVGFSLPWDAVDNGGLAAENCGLRVDSAGVERHIATGWQSETGLP